MVIQKDSLPSCYVTSESPFVVFRCVCEFDKGLRPTSEIAVLCSYFLYVVVCNSFKNIPMFLSEVYGPIEQSYVR